MMDAPQEVGPEIALNYQLGHRQKKQHKKHKKNIRQKNICPSVLRPNFASKKNLLTSSKET